MDASDILAWLNGKPSSETKGQRRDVTIANSISWEPLSPRDGGDLWFFFNLETDCYNAEREGDPGPDLDWTSTSVWNNYGRCSLSATKWGDEAGFLVSRFSKFNLDRLSGRQFLVDTLALEDGDSDGMRAR